MPTRKELDEHREKHPWSYEINRMLMNHLYYRYKFKFRDRIDDAASPQAEHSTASETGAEADPHPPA
jgi:hypothetical protein